MSADKVQWGTHLNCAPAPARTPGEDHESLAAVLADVVQSVNAIVVDEEVVSELMENMIKCTATYQGMSMQSMRAQPNPTVSNTLLYGLPANKK